MSTRPPTITMYTQKHCAPCHFTIRWLRDHDIVHRVINVDDEPGAREHLRALDHRQTPVVVTADGESWSGHNITFLSALLDAADTTDPTPTEASQASPGAAGPGGGQAGQRDVTGVGADRRVVTA